MSFLPLLSELDEDSHAENIKMEAYPGEGKDEAQAPEHQAVELHHPLDGGEGGAVELEDEAVVPAHGLGCLAGVMVIVSCLASFVTTTQQS